MNPVHVLIRLQTGYGLGDAVQISSVLRHLRKYRPTWIIDYQADEGRHSAAIGLVRNAFTYSDAVVASSYDREIDIVLYDTFAGWTDRPNTRVTQCLHERFGMAWDRELASYEINVTQEAKESAEAFLSPLLKNNGLGRINRVVCIQYQGDSAQVNKNLTHEQAADICQAVIDAGRVPLLMDWRNLSPLPDQSTIHTTGRMVMSSKWGRDAQMNAAIIGQCEAFIGIDSGPGKCASATDTPSLICWTANHPALFHDPCPNTTHLVPENHRQNPLLEGNSGAADFFEREYNWTTYANLVESVKTWIRKVTTGQVSRIPR